MMTHKIYHTEKHLIELSKGNKEEFWEITVGVYNQKYVGYAVLLSNPNVRVPITQLNSMHPLDEMITQCKKVVLNHDDTDPIVYY